MRRWLAIAVALLLALALAACGDDDDSGEAGGGTETSAPAADLGLKEAGTLLVGSDIPYPPFEFTEPGSDEVIGFDVDLVNAMAERLGIEQVRFVKQPFDTLFVSVAQGRFDMAASSATINPERAKVVDFGDPYFNATQSIMVQEGSDIASVDDLEGRRLGVQRGTTGADFAATVPGAKISRYDLFPDAANALAAGRVDAVINDYAVSAYAAEQSPGLVIAARVGAKEQYGLVFPKSNPALRDAFGTAFEEIKADGTFAGIYREWFGEDPPEELL